MNYKIGIYDSDFSYMVSFMEYVNSNERLSYKISGFSSESALNEYLSEHTLDVLLLADKCHADVSHIKVVKLTEDAGSKDAIFKYQCIDDILQKLDIAPTEGKSIIVKKAELIGVYSPLGRCGKTNFAHALCELFGNCVYLGLEEYPVLNKDDVCEGFDSDKFLYYIVNHNKKAIELYENNFKLTKKIIPVCNNYGDNRNIDGNSIMWFFHELKNTFHLDTMIVDVGTGVMEDISLLKCFEKLYIPALKDERSQMKLKLFDKYAQAESINYELVYLPDENSEVLTKMLKKEV